MWRRKKSRVLLNIFLIILIAAVVAVMYFGYKQISAQQAQQDKELVDLANKAKQQSQTAKEESYEALEAAYQKDVDTLAQYLPGIVCWGDVLTEGTASGISYPKTLQSLINRYLVTPYNFRSTVSNPYQYTRIDWNSYSIEIPVVNMGTGRESTQTVLGRSGAAPYVISKRFTIPADCSPVEVQFTGFDGTSVKPLISGDCGVNPVLINGIEGTLTPDPDSYSDYSNGRYYFTRTTPGTEMPVDKNTEILTDSFNKYRDYIHVIFIGSFGKYADAEDLANQVRCMISRQLQNPDRFIIIGNYAGPFQSSNFYDQFASLMTQEYGDRFINFRKYLMNEAMTEFGITSTYKDTQNLKYGHMPASIFVTGSDTELLTPLYEKLGELVFERMQSLGYFDEVRSELGIPGMAEVNASYASK